MNIQIRLERPADYRQVEELTRDAFWDVHVPGCDEHCLAHVLRSAACFVPELDLVAEFDGLVVGNIMYTRAQVLDSSAVGHKVLSFGPLSVLPEYQNRGIGALLIQESKQRALELGYTAIIIYGDPEYYQRFGFVSGSDFGIHGSEGYFSPALQVFELVPGALKGVSGAFLEDDVYHLDAEAASAFDAQFPPREKGFKPSQKRFQDLLSQAHK